MVLIVLCATGAALAQTDWVQYPGNPVVVPGDPGQWDERGRHIYSVVFDGATYHMYFTSPAPNGDLTDIGHATSIDRFTWIVDPNNPVVVRGAPGAWDADGLWSAAVAYDGSTFHMWYAGEGAGQLSVGHATSLDGSIWLKDPSNPVIGPGVPGSWNEFVAPWTVRIEGDTVKMWFYACCDDNGANNIGYAEFPGGIYPDPVLVPSADPSVWDSGFLCCPAVDFEEPGYHMFYIGGRSVTEGIGYAFSPDGIHWTKHAENPVVQAASGYIWNPVVLFDGSLHHLWYSHWNGSVFQINYAWSDGDAGLFADDFETGDTSLWSATVP
jgi:hypothetical protein